MWSIQFHEAFDTEFEAMAPSVQDELLAVLHLLKQCGPALGRPHVDTLNGSRYAKMKELRFTADGGVWRVAFAFDPKRSAILLVAGDKSGGSERRFYQWLLKQADTRFARHLTSLKEATDGQVI